MLRRMPHDRYCAFGVAGEQRQNFGIDRMSKRTIGMGGVLAGMVLKIALKGRFQTRKRAEQSPRIFPTLKRCFRASFASRRCRSRSFVASDP
jgi:hypothetical protein